MGKYGEDYFISCRFREEMQSFIGKFFEEANVDYISTFSYKIETKISFLLNQCDYKKDSMKASLSFLVNLGMPIEFTKRDKYLGCEAMLDWLGASDKYRNTKAFKSDIITFYFKSKDLYESVLNCL
jgi:hypothetical protein